MLILGHCFSVHNVLDILSCNEIIKSKTFKLKENK